MAAQQGNEDPAAFNHRVGRATILNLWVAVVSAILAIAAIAAIVVAVFLPQIQAWFKDEHPGITAFFSGVKAWLTTPWALPWTAWVLIIASAYGLGVLTVLVPRSERARVLLLRILEPIGLSFNPYMTRHEAEPLTRPLSREEEDEIAMASLAVPLPTVPEPEDMEVDQIAVLSQMGHRVRAVLSSDIASALKEPEAAIIAALQKLQSWGLVTSGMRYWNMTADGIEYVTKHRSIFLDRGKRPSK